MSEPIWLIVCSAGQVSVVCLCLKKKKKKKKKKVCLCICLFCACAYIAIYVCLVLVRMNELIGSAKVYMHAFPNAYSCLHSIVSN